MLEKSIFFCQKVAVHLDFENKGSQRYLPICLFLAREVVLRRYLYDKMLSSLTNRSIGKPGCLSSCLSGIPSDDWLP